MSKKIVFCGGGNMAEGIMGGILKHKIAAPEEITVNELVEARRDYLSSTYHVSAVGDATAALKEADVVVIAVNPPQVPSVTKVLAPIISKDTLVLSIAAGVAIEVIESQIGEDKKVVRIMPNTLIQSGNGYSAVCLNSNISDSDKEYTENFLSALGQVMYIPENKFDTFAAYSCPGPLWLYKLAEALIDAGVHSGFSRVDSRNMVIKNMLGVAMVLEETGDHPAVRVDKMTSPGGVTIEALKVLQEEGFAAAVMNSVEAAVNKVNNVK